MRSTEGKKYGAVSVWAEEAWLTGFGAVSVREGLAEGTMPKDPKDLRGYVHDGGAGMMLGGGRTEQRLHKAVNSRTMC